MATFDTVIRGGKVATAADVADCDIGIRGGRIVALGDDLGDAAQVIDARGKLVMPGGVDGHVHLDQDTDDGSIFADDFESGTRSAVCGGTTTVIPFVYQTKGRPLRQSVMDYHARATGKAMSDYAFHLILSDPNEQVLGQELPALIQDGYTSFKIYMTYDDLKLNDRQILDTLATARAHRAMVMVHAENADCIGWLTEKLEAAGLTAPRYHATSRPKIVEREATHRAISLAELLDTPILIVHVSGGDAIEQIRWAQGRGLKIYAETCPQYVMLTQEDLEKPGVDGMACICSPPPRDKESQEQVWRGLANGVFQVFSSDHAPFNKYAPGGKLVKGENATFREVPNGVPGVETRLPILFSEGVGKGRISLEQFVALTATNPAKMYGLHPRKGTIAVGSDADIAIWDPYRKLTIQNANLHHAVDYTPYEGREITGWPITTFVRGKMVWNDGEVLGVAGEGEFLPCAQPKPAEPAGQPVVDPGLWGGKVCEPV